ncbi:glutamate-5-semialdehyde dehydrogenase [Pedobacter sp. JCM 36344]|uniref:glutamate-5-semialdehyde dehydrogenase n=1 Tax=Pedobacter sp. JCM 36344 TaxID=3374280 RepID=UPI003979ACC5
MSAIQDILINAQRAKSSILAMDNREKQQLLNHLADSVTARSAEIIVENQKDVIKLDPNDPKLDRLLLNTERVLNLCKSLRAVANLADPTGLLLSEKILENGLKVSKVTVALGVVAVIYESRPNVTLDVAALCIRSGNVALLRGGQDAYQTNQILVSIIQQVLSESSLDPNIVQQLPPEREFIIDILTAEKYIDVIIPRGSNQLIEFVRKNATVPVIETGAGVCHTYVESTALLNAAVAIVINAKVSRPSVCNSLDTILIDQAIAARFLELLSAQLEKYDVEVFADDQSYQLLDKLGFNRLNRAAEEDFGREFLDYKCSIKIVSGIEEALEHINKYSSKHSEAILTENQELAELFLKQVDAAVVYLNASTRFTDGEVFGLGAEIGISTQKLHARGPFALEKLVTEKWIVKGTGQIR